VVGQVLDGPQQQRRRQAGDTREESDDDDPAAELEVAPRHWVNLCQ
jgi:hypothetical protein